MPREEYVAKDCEEGSVERKDVAQGMCIKHEI